MNTARKRNCKSSSACEARQNFSIFTFAKVTSSSSKQVAVAMWDHPWSATVTLLRKICVTVIFHRM